MMFSSGLKRRARWAGPALVAASAVVVTVAPSASATVVEIDKQLPATGTYEVGTVYEIWMGPYVEGLLNERIVLADNGKCFKAVTRHGQLTSAGSVAKIWTINWVPTTPGSHTITVTSTRQRKTTVTVNVLPAPAGTQLPPESTYTGCDDPDGAGSTGS